MQKSDSRLKDGRCWSYEGENELGVMTDGISGELTSAEALLQRVYPLPQASADQTLCKFWASKFANSLKQTPDKEAIPILILFAYLFQ